MAYTYYKEDHVLRYINGEWINVSAKCKPAKNLGYYDDATIYFEDDCDYDQIDKYKYDVEMDDRGDDVDDVDDFLPRYSNNQRPDLFWMGDGYREQMHPNRRQDGPMSVRSQHHIHNRGDDIVDNHQKFAGNGCMRCDQHSTFSSMRYGGKPRSARFMPPRRETMNHTMYGYHPYSWPMIAAEAALPSPNFQTHDNHQPKFVTSTTRCQQQPAQVKKHDQSTTTVKVSTITTATQTDQKYIKQEPMPESDQKNDEVKPEPKYMNANCTYIAHDFAMKSEDDENFRQ